MIQDTQTKRVPAIDGLRGFAALYVLAFHYFLKVESGSSVLDTFLHYGYSAVPLFFVISGYLVYTSTEKRSKEDPRWRLNFYLGRAFRILPLWWAVLAFMLLNQMISVRVFLVNASFLFGFLSFDDQFLPIIQAWSLFVEECFYLLFPSVKSRLNSWLDTFIICVFFIIYSRFWCEMAVHWGVPTHNGFIERAPLANFNFLFLGVLIGHVFKNPIFSTTLRNARFSQARMFDILAIASFFAPAFKISMPQEVACGLILISALHGRGFLAKIWNCRPLCRIGQRCYAVYISHTLIFSLSWRIKSGFSWLFHLSGNTLELYWFPCILVLVIGFAELSWVLWEQPWQRVGRRLMSRLSLRPATILANPIKV